MLFFLTNGAAICVIILLFAIAYMMDPKFLKTITTTKITMMAMQVALIVLLTNFLGYSGVFGARLMLGNFILFLSGMLFGPMGGALVGALSYTAGMVNPGIFIHFSFMAAYMIYAMLGSLVFIKKQKSRLSFMISVFVLLFIASFTLTFISHPIAMLAIGKNAYVYVTLVNKFIVFPIDAVIEPILIISTFEVSILVLKRVPNTWNQLWCTRFDSLEFLNKQEKKSKKDLKITQNKPIITSQASN
ncbi:folate family ECF transporter S component [Mycoplasma mycoides subsp. capri]|uniref:folate family ECF transporter S component n=1 Tax=Mycoplasma mycoides TaxID=2102 RepID=UPI00223F7922|nr:folate family ECF transporter S component [Mycoplasma mycoides]QVK00502.1 folate family ECF transporter S component [Mycoplasma mycoides subsp. capri]